MPLLLLLFISDLIIINPIYSFRYTLPSDSTWPNNNEFINLRNNITGKVMIKGDSDYKPHTWNRITNVPKPAVIVQPANSNDIIIALKFAKTYNIRLSVQSTGHHQDHRNIYDNSVHIDMSSMKSKSINLTQKTLTLQTGNSFKDIHSYVYSQTSGSLVALGGADPGVGIYGWTSGGGHGYLTRTYGLGVDALVSIDLINSNLTIITASETQNQDLFRAIRGSGGPTYGIAISLTVRLYNDPGKVSVFNGVYPLSTTTGDTFSNWMINAPNNVGAYFLPNNLDSKYIYIAAFCFGNSSVCGSAFTSLYSGCVSSCTPSTDKFNNFFEYFNSVESNTGGVTYLTSTVLTSSNILAALREIINFLITNSYTGCSANAILGGVSSTLDPNQVNTSVSIEMRQGIMAITCFSGMDDSSSSAIRKYQTNIMDNLAENIFKKYSNWVYWNEPQHDFPKNDWKERYWGNLTNYNKLLTVKNKYDPENFFSCYHCVGYERFDNEDPSVCPATKCTCSNTPNGECNKLSKFNSNIIVISIMLMIFFLY